MAARRANPRYLPDASLPDRVTPVAAAAGGAAGRRGCRLCGAVARPARGRARGRLVASARRVLVSATKVSKPTRCSACRRSSPRKTAGAAGRRALRPELRGGSRARAADGAARRRRSTRPRRHYVQERFRGPALRLYVSDDVAGVEIGGALKNVIAIAAGVVEGLGLGHNAMAALITRGLAEISRLACAEGGRRETLAGLSGLGDLVLTCTGDSEPQPPRRHRARPRPAARTRFSRACAWSPKVCARPAPRSRSARGTASSCRSPPRWPPCSTAAARRREAVDVLMGRRQRAEADMQ